MVPDHALSTDLDEEIAESVDMERDSKHRPHDHHNDYSDECEDEIDERDDQSSVMEDSLNEVL